MRLRALPLLLGAFGLAGCRQSTSMEQLQLRPVLLPDGSTIQAETMIHPTDMARGMMFRDSLAENRGMLFVHGQPGRYTYWMYQVRVPLDILWMDSGKRVVEVSANTPPCRESSARRCPSYGGTQNSQYVLELAGGVAARHGLKVGDVIAF